MSDARSTRLKESEPQTTELREGLKYLVLGEDRPLGFEKVLMHSIETLGPKNGKGHLKGSSSEKGIKLSFKPPKVKYVEEKEEDS